MNVGITYTTSDGRTWEDRELAEAHQALVSKIDAFLADKTPPRSIPRQRNLLLLWCEQHDQARTGLREVK